MRKSQFEFTNPELTRLNFEIHEDFCSNTPVNIGIDLSVRISDSLTSEETGESTATVAVTLRVGSKDNSSPFYIEADESANYRWNNRIFSDSEVESLLKGNAVALLISYLRPIISTITAASRYPAYNLPYLNLMPIQDHATN